VNIIIKSILILLYPLLLMARLKNTILRRDPLRLRERRAESLWLTRDDEHDTASYFSESSRQTDEQRDGLIRITKVTLRKLARCFAPPRRAPGAKYSAAVDRQKGIPDEVYTLW
jgi:hypothetical protein